MKTNVADTSIENYHLHRERGELSRQELQILGVMQRGRDYSRAEIAEATGMRLSSVCGRVNELVKINRLSEAPARPCKVTGRTISPVFLVPSAGVQCDLFSKGLANVG